MTTEPHGLSRCLLHMAPTTVSDAQDRLVLTGVSKIVLAAIDTITGVGRACRPEMREHVQSLTQELAGVTVDWVGRWPR